MQQRRRYRTLSDFMERRKLDRVEVRWPVTMITDRGAVEGEVRNVTVEGVFIQSLEKLALNEIYRLFMKAGEENISMTRKLV